MHRSSMLLVGLIGLAGWTLGCGGQLRLFPTDPTLLQPRAGPVTVTVLCPTVDAVSIGVTPLSVGVDIGANVTWELVGTNVVFEITSTTRKGLFRRRHWPFAGQPHRSNNNGRATASNARGKAGNRYPYKVTAQCQVPDGGPLVEISLDPEVIITED